MPDVDVSAMSVDTTGELPRERVVWARVRTGDGQELRRLELGLIGDGATLRIQWGLDTAATLKSRALARWLRDPTSAPLRAGATVTWRWHGQDPQLWFDEQSCLPLAGLTRELLERLLVT